MLCNDRETAYFLLSFQVIRKWKSHMEAFSLGHEMLQKKILQLQVFDLKTYRNKTMLLTTAPLLGSVILTGNTFLMVV
jgi:hypothetical protein